VAPAVSYAVPACYSSYDPPTERPANAVIEYCADGGTQLIQMTWIAWGPGSADGKGVFAVKSCQPDCAHGPTIEYPVTIHATNPFHVAPNIGCGPSTAVYSDLTLAFPTASVPQNINNMNANSSYEGLPAIHFTTVRTIPGQSVSDPAAAGSNPELRGSLSDQGIAWSLRDPRRPVSNQRKSNRRRNASVN
jgi:hypothetical protein